MGKKLGYQKSDLPITEAAASSILRLPIYPDLSFSNLKYIIKSLKKIFKELKLVGG